LGLLAAVVALALPASASAFTPEQIAGFQQILQLDQQQAGYPGEVLGVWQQGNGGFVGTAGVSNLITNAPISTADHWRVGSVTKTFTATVVLQLAQHGELRLSDHIDRFLKGIPGGRHVTVKRLLNQTSGFPDISNKLSNEVLANPHRQWNVRKLVVGSLRQQPSVCAPGACWHYSNVNYLALGMIAAKAGGMRVRDLLERGVFDRLGLRHTSLKPSRPIPAPAAHGYQFNAANVAQDTTGWNFSWAWTAGGLTSTLHDLRRYCPAMATGHGLLDRRMERKRLNFVDISQDIQTPGAGYGLGVFALPTVAGTFIGHDGGVPGFDTVCVYAPQSRTTIIAFGTTCVELDPISPDRIPVQMLFTVVPALAQIVAAT
jgi:D-alanyl-D-alanine carboxypeptidase